MGTRHVHYNYKGQLKSNTLSLIYHFSERQLQEGTGLANAIASPKTSSSDILLTWAMPVLKASLNKLPFPVLVLVKFNLGSVSSGIVVMKFALGLWDIKLMIGNAVHSRLNGASEPD